MKGTRWRRTGTSSARAVAEGRVSAALHCVNVLCPQLDHRGKRQMVRAILALAAGQAKQSARKQITDPQIVEMVWRHSQCINPHCPLLVFGREFTQELNDFFQEEE